LVSEEQEGEPHPPEEKPDRSDDEPVDPEPPQEPEKADEGHEIPESPWRTGTIRNLEIGEVLGVAFLGKPVEGSIGAQFAGQALSALDDLVTILAASRYGKVGERGPVRLPGGIGALRLAGVGWGSAVFYFRPGEGDAFRLSVNDSSTQVSSGAEDVMGQLMELVEAGSSDEVLTVAQRYNDRVAAKYVQFLEVVVAEQVGVAWRTRDRDPVLPRSTAGRALAMLEQTEEVSSEQQEVEGILYEANARTRGFRLLLDDGTLILGRFDEALSPHVGEAWNQRVSAGIRIRVERLARSGNERLTFELRELAILDPGG
jgi:hypothetical protein